MIEGCRSIRSAPQALGPLGAEPNQFLGEVWLVTGTGLSDRQNRSFAEPSLEDAFATAAPVLLSPRRLNEDDGRMVERF